MFTQLYNKCLKLAAHKSANYFLGAISFIESSFFPIPPDVMIAPMAVAKKNDFFKIFLIATIFSVLGGIFGYFLGVYFFDFAMNIVEFYNYERKMLDIKDALSQGDGFYTWLAILFLAGFTPLPYKVFTIASGLIGFNLIIFIVISFISRGFRFFLVSYLSSKFGDSFTNYMNQHGQKWFTILGIIIVFIVAIFYISIKFYG
jgi:membrane protein YqaA with SNARE-associated domain